MVFDGYHSLYICIIQWSNNLFQNWNSYVMGFVMLGIVIFCSPRHPQIKVPLNNSHSTCVFLYVPSYIAYGYNSVLYINNEFSNRFMRYLWALGNYGVILTSKRGRQLTERILIVLKILLNTSIVFAVGLISDNIYSQGFKIELGLFLKLYWLLPCC